MDREKDIEEAEKIIGTVELWEDLSTLELRQLFAFQRLIGYVIEEKIKD
jgi:hypothetical protein